ncbi:MAG: GNAT family N-acetyltransferase [Clostridia bacterium]|nr:GNAT family N-acetyltransferase [Clostridia bacterium]
MNLELIKDIYNLHIKAFEGLDFNVIRKNNCEITYNKNIKDCYSNFISNFDVRDKQEFENIINEADKIFGEINRTTAVYLIPFMKELYNKRQEYFEKDKYELVSTEAWQIYDDFSKLDNITTNCELNVTLELATDMKEYANCVMGCYQTDDEDDPYGDLDEEYRQGYMNYKDLYSDIKNEFYYIKVDDEVVGTTQSVYNNKVYGIYSLAIKKDYRNKGIGKEVLKQQLQMCKSKNISTAYLQTEQGFYPNKMYQKFGFKDLCLVYYYLKK